MKFSAVGVGILAIYIIAIGMIFLFEGKQETTIIYEGDSYQKPQIPSEIRVSPQKQVPKETFIDEQEKIVKSKKNKEKEIEEFSLKSTKELKKEVVDKIITDTSTTKPTSHLFEQVFTPTSATLSTNIPQEELSGISVDGSVKLFAKDGYARVVGVDQDNNEHLIYATDSLFVKDEDTFSNSCEETCSILTPKKFVEIKTEVYKAELSINNINFKKETTNSYNQQIKPSVAAEIQKVEQQDFKLKKLKEQKLSWTPGETSISKLSYAEKKKLFTKPSGEPLGYLPNMQGFEYYTGGVFRVESEQNNVGGKQVADKALYKHSSQNTDFVVPKKFDYRDYQGENWLTSVKSQGSAGTCWAHSNIGTVESLINLYYNKQINLDLSEQQVVDCANKGPIEELSVKPKACMEDRCYPDGFCKLIEIGAVDEACDPYASREFTYNPSVCDYEHVCNDWNKRLWKIDDFTNYMFGSDRGASECSKNVMDPSEEEFKAALIKYGPIDSGILTWNHAMVLVGYEDNSDWLVTDTCAFNEMCEPGLGCEPKSCLESEQGQTRELCFNEFEGDIIKSRLYTYRCDHQYFDIYEWKQKYSTSCGEGKVCMNNECVLDNEFELNIGDKTCISKDTNKYFKEYAEYRPGQGEEYWIFKNSWGENWGEDGYAKIAVSFENMGWGSQPYGPVTAPANKDFWPNTFNDEIICEDNDGDNYCYWGKSEEQPESCGSNCLPEKDCDDTNELLGPFISETNLNCEVLNPPVEDCEDSDGGVDIYKKGIVSGGEGNDCENDECEDICSGLTLKEYYCEENIVLNEDIDCQFGCEDGACKKESQYAWTAWFDRDNPSGNGDYETIANQPEVCAKPIDIECQTISGQDWKDAGQNVTCNTQIGFFCKNSYEFYCFNDDYFNRLNPKSSDTFLYSSNEEKDMINCKYPEKIPTQYCKDYKVRYLCPLTE